MDDRTAEGWYVDPYGVHEDRWMSAGRPTNLVRDGSIEAEDGPPAGAVPVPLSPAIVNSTASAGPRDLLRADDAGMQPIPDAGSYAIAAMDGNVRFNNSLLGGPAVAGNRNGMMFETPFQRKMRQRARKLRWADRKQRWFGTKP